MIHALEVLTKSRDNAVVGMATAYLNSVSAPSFLLCLEILSTVLSVTKPLSVRLQAQNQDLLQAVRSVDDCMGVLQSYRDGDEFDRVFDRVQEAVEDPIPLPRGNKKCSPTVTTARQHYKISVFLPFIDTCLSQLRERFRSHRARGMMLCSLLPSVCETRTFEDLRVAVEQYASFLDCGAEEEVRAEFLCWQQHWKRRDKGDRPQTVLDALREAREAGIFPAVATLLQIFATLPVTTATNERSFSALKYLKNYLRSTMTQERLNGLALLYVHRTCH